MIFFSYHDYPCIRSDGYRSNRLVDYPYILVSDHLQVFIELMLLTYLVLVADMPRSAEIANETRFIYVSLAIFATLAFQIPIKFDER